MTQTIPLRNDPKKVAMASMIGTAIEFMTIISMPPRFWYLILSFLINLTPSRLPYFRYRLWRWRLSLALSVRRCLGILVIN